MSHAEQPGKHAARSNDNPPLNCVSQRERFPRRKWSGNGGVSREWMNIRTVVVNLRSLPLQLPMLTWENHAAKWKRTERNLRLFPLCSSLRLHFLQTCEWSRASIQRKRLSSPDRQRENALYHQHTVIAQSLPLFSLISRPLWPL